MVTLIGPWSEYAVSSMINAWLPLVNKQLKYEFEIVISDCIPTDIKVQFWPEKTKGPTVNERNDTFPNFTQTKGEKISPP
jgi:hypothetical protein